MFFDEVDALGGRRMNDRGASVERASSLDVLLRRIEMFQGIALAATRAQDFLDPALWRRFGMQISVDLAGADERFAIIRRTAAPFELDDDETDEVVVATAGASPALLRNLMEGIKRTVVVAPRVGRKVDDAAGVLASVVAACAPAPEYEPPPLWADRRSIANVARALAWPLRRSQEPAP